jgi:hypothetical protein
MSIYLLGLRDIGQSTVLWLRSCSQDLEAATRQLWSLSAASYGELRAPLLDQAVVHPSPCSG